MMLSGFLKCDNGDNEGPVLQSPSYAGNMLDKRPCQTLTFQQLTRERENVCVCMCVRVCTQMLV